MFSGFIKALSGLIETVVLSPFDFTEIGFASISPWLNFTLHDPFDRSTTSPPNVLFSPINSATNEFTGYSYNLSGDDNC